MAERQLNENESNGVDQDAQKEIDEYWTPERREQASPEPLPEITQEELEALIEKSRKEEGQPTERVESLESYSPEPEATTGTPTEADVGERPFWNGGIIFFTKPDGTDMYGSAEFCGQNNIVLTAAHCVRDHQSGEWYKNVWFARAYRNLLWAQTVSIGWLTTKKAWHSGTSGAPHDVDYAFLTTSTT